jgi:fumarate hydratase, class II
MGSKKPVHPNDHVNMGQSSNDTFPTAMHVAIGMMARDVLLPGLRKLHAALAAKSEDSRHHQDRPDPYAGRHAPHAGPGIRRLRPSGRHGDQAGEMCLPAIYELAQGGTAVGTGPQHPQGLRREGRGRDRAVTGLPFVTAPNKFEALAAHDAMVMFSGALKTVAASLFKIANDMRFWAPAPAPAWAS